jgi:DNA (cytosine-5)-methyltransferase 1
MAIPVIDLFSGPGGLGEGFSALNEGSTFRTIVSAEKDPAAHATLTLRSYFRRVRTNDIDARAYYDYCNGKSNIPTNGRTQSAWRDAIDETRQLTLGHGNDNALLDSIIQGKLKKNTDCVLIGGPPCQAYSLVGRSRNMGKADYLAEKDSRHFLYMEYLRVIQRFKPSIFVMENVKGMLSSRVGGKRIFHEILKDLVNPDAAILDTNHGRTPKYKIYSLVTDTVFENGMDPKSIDPRDFVVRSERYGIPQARHRVILLGVREDLDVIPGQLVAVPGPAVINAIGDLPALRSRLTHEPDTASLWARRVTGHLHDLSRDAAKRGLDLLAQTLAESASRIRQDLTCGALRCNIPAFRLENDAAIKRWYHDQELEVILNHEARGHMSSDLRRYAYAAAFARCNNISPKGHANFQLKGLRPSHANWESGNFSDRFRVQLWNAPSTTITSHISKDGHYFIHPDVDQCRSLTVREAARLQTFPDNYFFSGTRTEQYHQVGNAVPPYLARQIASVVLDCLNGAPGLRTEPAMPS